MLFAIIVLVCELMHNNKDIIIKTRNNFILIIFVILYKLINLFVCLS